MSTFENPDILISHTKDTCERQTEIENFYRQEMMPYPIGTEPLPRISGFDAPDYPDYFERQMQMFDQQFQEPVAMNEGAQMDKLFQMQEALFESPGDEALSLEQAIFNENRPLMDISLPSEPHTSFNHEFQMDTILSNQHEIEEQSQLAFSPLEQSVLDQPVETMDLWSGQQNLEHNLQYEMPGPEMIPETMQDQAAYDNNLMPQEIFETMMHEAADQMEQEPMPQPAQFDNNMMPQEMYPPQMPEMYDPQMEEMMDPYMMPGPFGPLGPGPGI